MSILQISERTEKKLEKEITVVDLKGSLDAHTAARMDEALSALIKAEKINVIVNFSSLEYISSAGMGLFIGWIDNFRSKGGDILMVSLRQNVLRVFKILGFDKIFSILENENDALAKF